MKVFAEAVRVVEAVRLAEEMRLAEEQKAMAEEQNAEHVGKKLKERSGRKKKKGCNIL